jgi:glycosyltransferase involved in cell wall biosynthesis
VHYSEKLVSVVIPTYNSGRFIREAVLSAIHQTYSNTEIVVVDDGSADDTREVLLPLLHEEAIQYIYQANKGPAAARNRAISIATGEFVAFLDADDTWLPRKLEKQLALFANPHVGLVYSDGATFIEEGDTVEDLGFVHKVEPRLHYRRGRVYSDLLRSNFVSTSSVVLRREVLDRAGPFLESMGAGRFSYGEDYELWLRVARICELDFIDEKLVASRLHRDQLSSDRARGYTQLSLLYKYLLLKENYSKKAVLAQKYAEYTLKSTIAGLFRIR